MSPTFPRSFSFLGLTVLRAVLAPTAYALNAGCSPGGNFDLSHWELQLPIGSPGSPETISSGSLEGCGGWSNSDYFYTGSDGSLVMKVPGDTSTGCVTTPSSTHCRTELHEINPGTWDPTSGVNRLAATLAVIAAGGSTCIGQVHIVESAGSTKPVAELFYADSGDIEMGVEQTRAGGNEIRTTIGNIPLGTRFSYEIRYENGVLQVSLNGGALQTLSTYQLGNPPSYFKAGNYLQGSNPSEVHFYDISVVHGSAAVPWPPASATSARSGIGPFNIMYQVDHTTTVNPTATPTSCGLAPPAKNDNTVTLNLYSDFGCCSSFETIKLGSLNQCHNGNAAFGSLMQSVSQSMFGQGIHLYAYAEADCGGTPADMDLTNDVQCTNDKITTNWQSFKLAISGAPAGNSNPGCTVQQPVSSGNDNTVTLDLFASSCCDKNGPFQNFTIGNLGVCHTAKQQFNDFTQRVGSNLFGQDIHVVLYGDSACADHAFSVFDLSNNAVCYEGSGWNSFKVEKPAASGAKGQLSAASSTCNAQPENDSDNTLTLDLYPQDGCCGTLVENIKIGNLGTCHNGNAAFTSFNMQVGTNLFGASNHVLLYAGRDCTGTVLQQDLTNSATCWQGATWQSFMVAPPGSSGSGVCTGAPNNGGDDGTVTFELYGDGDCCSSIENIKMGTLDSCHSSNADFTSFQMDVGQNMFGQDVHFLAYSETNCQGEVWSKSLTNNVQCWQGHTWKSMKIASV
ncbi:alginate lyase-domain-containing protein [Lophiotrema nucula]|uniref:Alginate lyase-domain-containing protein n=1 Tax=Lophiotrema nucula TaxID=690887 RepID=A0A6A5YXQ1_9PLEO|nr:alginate lyase-domain-containing protein [Lophiotrema nucula]